MITVTLYGILCRCLVRLLSVVRGPWAGFLVGRSLRLPLIDSGYIIIPHPLTLICGLTEDNGRVLEVTLVESQYLFTI